MTKIMIEYIDGSHGAYNSERYLITEKEFIMTLDGKEISVDLLLVKSIQITL